MRHGGVSSGGVEGGGGLDVPGLELAGPVAGTAIQRVAGWAVVVPVRAPIRVVEFGPARERPSGAQPDGSQFAGSQVGRDGAGLAFWCRELGCTRVELMDLSRVGQVVLGLATPGLCLWLDEEAGLRDPMPEVNVRARRVLVAVWGQRGAPWVRGTAMFTGSADRHGRCQGLSQLAAQALIGVITSDYPTF